MLIRPRLCVITRVSYTCVFIYKKYRSVKRERYCRERNAPCRVACYWTMLDACLGKRCEIFHRKKKKKKKEEKEIERIFEKEFLYPEKKSLPNKILRTVLVRIRVRISCIYIYFFFLKIVQKFNLRI